MAAYSSNPGGMDEMYSDAEPAAKKPDDATEGEGATATIPKALLAGKDFKPGEEIVLRIVSIGEDDAVVEYAPPKGEEEPHDDSEMPPHDESAEGGGGGAPDEYASMME